MFRKRVKIYVLGTGGLFHIGFAGGPGGTPGFQPLQQEEKERCWCFSGCPGGKTKQQMNEAAEEDHHHSQSALHRCFLQLWLGAISGESAAFSFTLSHYSLQSAVLLC